MNDREDVPARLGAAIAGGLGPPGDILNLTRLTGGATKATWSFDALVGDKTLPLILQQSVPPSAGPGEPMARLCRVSGDGEAALLRAAARSGVPVPRVRFVLRPSDGLGTGLVTDRVEGETLGGRINRDGRFAAARETMAAQCGSILAGLHGMDTSQFPFLVDQGPAAQVALYREILDSFDHPQPAIELGLSWASERLPKQSRTTFVHGDFRNGNFIVGPEGIRAVLDWEIAHVGDPMEDLGWLTVRTWRFGGKKPVGGFGRRQDLYEAYERAGGGPVVPEHVTFWEAFGSVKWSIMCMMKGQSYLRGGSRTVEALAIGRRTEEPLYDFLRLIHADQ